MNKQNRTLFLKDLTSCNRKKGRILLFKIWRKIFFIAQRLGIHIIPNHYYFPVPDTRTLHKLRDSHYQELIGIDMNEIEQLDLLSLFENSYKHEFNKFPRYKTKIPYQYYSTNGNFRSVDGEILYCMIRHFKPKLIIEIGAGYSTFCSAQAILKNKEFDKKYDCDLISIEPYPNNILKAKFPGFKKLIEKKIQDVDISLFKSLKENDILFIDSSHILNIGSDVHHEYIRILPSINKGVFVHIHDIFLPLEYPIYWIYDLLRFYNEQYLLQSFLTFNHSFKVIWAAKYMQTLYSNKLEAVFDSYKNDVREIPKNFAIQNKDIKKIWPIEWPTSFWIKRI